MKIKETKKKKTNKEKRKTLGEKNETLCVRSGFFWVLLDFIPNLDLFHPILMCCYMERVHVGIIGVFYSQGLCFLFLEETLSFSFQYK